MACEVVAVRGPESDVVVTAAQVGSEGLAELEAEGWEPLRAIDLQPLIDEALRELVESACSLRFAS